MKTIKVEVAVYVNGFAVLRATKPTIDMAIEELGRAERIIEGGIDDKTLHSYRTSSKTKQKSGQN